MINTQVTRYNHLIMYGSMASYLIGIEQSYEREQTGRDLLTASSRGSELQKEYRELCGFELQGSLSTHTEIVDTLYLFSHETPLIGARDKALRLIQNFNSL